MRRLRHKKPEKSISTLAKFCLVITLFSLGFAAIAYAQGKIKLEKLPEGTVPTLIAIGVIIVALFVVAAFSLPAAHGCVKWMERSLSKAFRPREARASGWRWPWLVASPFLAIGWVVSWPIRAILILLSFALIALSIVFLVRLGDPGFLQDWVDRLLEWLR